MVHFAHTCTGKHMLCFAFLFFIITLNPLHVSFSKKTNFICYKEYILGKINTYVHTHATTVSKYSGFLCINEMNAKIIKVTHF